MTGTARSLVAVVVLRDRARRRCRRSLAAAPAPRARRLRRPHRRRARRRARRRLARPRTRRAKAGPAAAGAGDPRAIRRAGRSRRRPPPTSSSAQLERLAKDPGPLKTNWTPPGKSERYGHAEGLIAAPYDVVKARLLDFPHYKELAGPKFKKVSVVDKSASGTDLYFQLPIMKGLVTIWYVTRFGTARPAMGGAEVIEGKFVKGNIKDMQIVFTIRPGPDDRRRSSCAI